jgi:hypothetical protein
VIEHQLLSCQSWSVDNFIIITQQLGNPFLLLWSSHTLFQEIFEAPVIGLNEEFFVPRDRAAMTELLQQLPAFL